MAKVSLKQVYKIYSKNVVAVDNFNLDIGDKEFIVLVGPSGCGKSTTLRMIAGLEEISKGELYIDDRLMNETPPKDRDIAMVFQNYALYPHMSVYDNMAFGLTLRKLPKPEIKQRVKEAADILGISDLLDRKPKALSGGQRQRVALGRAIVRNPRVFLFDEPLSNLDAKLRVQTRTEIAKLHRRLETTMIYVTHDQVEAMTMGDRIVVMKDGLIMQIDSPLNLYNRPANRFVAGFIGSPAMNFVDGRIIRENGLHFIFEEHHIPLPQQLSETLDKVIDKPVTLGIRPEDIHDKTSQKDIGHSVAFRMTAEVIEPMGNENYMYLTIGQSQLVARVPSTVEAEVGSECEMIFDLSRIHLFDGSTEKALLN